MPLRYVRAEGERGAESKHYQPEVYDDGRPRAAVEAPEADHAALARD